MALEKQIAARWATVKNELQALREEIERVYAPGVRVSFKKFIKVGEDAPILTGTIANSFVSLRASATSLNGVASLHIKLDDEHLPCDWARTATALPDDVSKERNHVLIDVLDERFDITFI